MIVIWQELCGKEHVWSIGPFGISATTEEAIHKAVNKAMTSSVI